MGSAAQDGDRLAKRTAIDPFAVDAEAAVPLHHPAVDRSARGEDLPRGDDMKRNADRFGRLVHYVRVVVEGVIGGDQHAVAVGDPLGDLLGSGDGNLNKLLPLEQLATPHRA